MPKCDTSWDRLSGSPCHWPADVSSATSVAEDNFEDLVAQHQKPQLHSYLDPSNATIEGNYLQENKMCFWLALAKTMSLVQRQRLTSFEDVGCNIEYVQNKTLV